MAVKLNTRYLEGILREEEIAALNEKYGREKVLEFNGRPLCSNALSSHTYLPSR